MWFKRLPVLPANFPQVSLISEFREKSLGLQTQMLHCVFIYQISSLACCAPCLCLLTFLSSPSSTSHQQPQTPALSHLSFSCISQSRDTLKISFDYQIRHWISRELQFQDYTCSIWGPTCRIKFSRKQKSNSTVWDTFLTQDTRAICQDHTHMCTFIYTPFSHTSGQIRIVTTMSLYSNCCLYSNRNIPLFLRST